MNYQINIAQMRKKTEVEFNLLEQINQELKSCKEDLKNIYETKKITPIIELDNYSKLNNCSKLDDITNIFDKKNIDMEIQNKLMKKLFAHIENTYNAFLFFYLKKRDFMGMNLTGMIGGKMETGLGFRKCLEKLSYHSIKTKYPELLNFNSINNCDIWKVKSDIFEWDKYDLELFINIIIISNYKDNLFYLLVEKN